MSKPLTVRHSYNAGDLIASLPGFKHIFTTTGRKTAIYQEIDFEAGYYEGAEHPIKNESGKEVSVNQKTFDMLNPLISGQEYIESFEVWRGQSVDIDLAKARDSRSIPIPYGSIFTWPFMAFPDLSCDLSIPWIKVESEDIGNEYLKDKIIINRTSRYNNPYISYFFLKEYEDIILFIGTNNEWAEFNRKYGLNVSYLLFNDFLTYARAIHDCKFFIGNQSFFWHLANGMGKKSILEVCSAFPNCWPTNGNGNAVLYQNALEHTFTKLISQID